MNLKRSIAVAGTVATVVAAGAVAVAFAGGGDSAAGSGQGAPDVAPRFAVLSDPGASSALDGTDRQLLASMTALTGKYHADWSAARVATETSGGQKLIVTAGDGYVCFVLASADPKLKEVGGGTCASNETANRDGAAVVSGEVPNAVVAGIVPDGVAEVTVSYADGSQKVVAVDHNAYVIQSAAASREIAFSGPAGSSTRALAPYNG